MDDGVVVIGIIDIILLISLSTALFFLFICGLFCIQRFCFLTLLFSTEF